MEIKIDKTGDILKMNVSGSLNTQTAPELEKKLQENAMDVQQIILDFDGLDYISSAGLRVVLAVQNKMDETDGKLVIRNAGEAILEVFDMTGFTSILTLE